MKVKIKDKDYEYIPDYPNGWERSTRDYSKSPVLIGPHQCFIKRFERKAADDISGWQLLQNLKGKYEQNIPRVYDMAVEKESGKDIYYVFYEYIESDTLDQLITRKAPVNLERFTVDLFSALQSIHVKNYWFADFYEKNILCEKGGRFLLVDLDSTQPTFEPPDIDMFGNKEYWYLVFNYYREILHQRNLKPEDINGVSLNYLQAVYLILRLKLSYVQNLDYYSTSLLNSLPAYLNEASPLFQQIYAEVFRNRELALTFREIAEIKKLTLDLLQNKHQPLILKPGIPPPIRQGPIMPALNPPVILHFSMSNYSTNNTGVYYISDGEPFLLSWKVQGAVRVELYRNEERCLDVDGLPKSIQLSEHFDGAHPEIEFKLIATGASGASASSSLKFKITVPFPEPAIEHFSVSNYAEKNDGLYVVYAGDQFTLDWEVKNAENLELHKSDGEVLSLSSADKSIVLPGELKEGKELRVEYTLRASTKGLVKNSGPVVLFIQKRPEPPPEIIEFKASLPVVKSRRPFKLKWHAVNCHTLMLFRNGEFYLRPAVKDNSMQIEEDFNVAETMVEYVLVAYNDSAEIKSFPVVVKVLGRGTKTGLNKTYIRTGWIAAIIVIAFFAGRWLMLSFSRPAISIRNTEPTEVYEDSALTIVGEKFADANSISVLFNDVEGQILSVADNRLVVKVPDLQNKILVKGIVTVTLVANGHNIYSHYFKWLDKSTVIIKDMNTSGIQRDSTVTIFGNNLDKGVPVKVYFNNIPGEIRLQAPDSLVVAVPGNVIADTTYPAITVNVMAGVRTIYRKAITSN